MGKLYTVALISRSQMRDIQLESILNDDFCDDDYIHEGDFDYIFEHDNKISTSISGSSKIYKTLNGAKRFRDNVIQGKRFNLSYQLKYPIRDEQGRWIYSSVINDTQSVVIVDITDRWDSFIDGIISKKTEEFESEISKLRLKKSK